MKNSDSEECESAIKKTHNCESPKKDAGVSKITRFYKIKKYSFGKNIKLSKSATSASITDSKSVDCDIGGSSLFADTTSFNRQEDSSCDKSVPVANLTETSWKSAENSDQYSSNTKTRTKSVISIETSKYIVSVQKAPTIKRAKSLEDMQKMPAYGDLILDPSSTMSNLHQTGVKPKDHLYKILVIGDLGAGKTSIIKRYVHQFFSQHYRATIGVDFALKVLNWDVNTLIRLQLWDIAGQERYGNMTRVYYKEAVGAFIVFDVTRANTFESVANWKADLDSKVQLSDGSPIPCVLLANKCDQQKEGLVNNKTKMDEYCKEKGFAAWFETSAKENINIDEAARTLVNQILMNDKLINDVNKDGDQFSLASNSNDAKKKSCSC